MSNKPQLQTTIQVNSDCYQCKECGRPATVCVTLDWVKRPLENDCFGEPEVVADGPYDDESLFYCQKHYELWL